MYCWLLLFINLFVVVYRFVRLCEDAYLILRRHASLFINMLAMMLQTGIPELRSIDDLNYVRCVMNTLTLNKEIELRSFALFLHDTRPRACLSHSSANFMCFSYHRSSASQAMSVLILTLSISHCTLCREEAFKQTAFFSLVEMLWKCQRERCYMQPHPRLQLWVW